MTSEAGRNRPTETLHTWTHDCYMCGESFTGEAHHAVCGVCYRRALAVLTGRKSDEDTPADAALSEEGR
jgi:hypothetical protein